MDATITITFLQKTTEDTEDFMKITGVEITYLKMNGLQMNLLRALNAKRYFQCNKAIRLWQITPLSLKILFQIREIMIFFSIQNILIN